MKYIALFEGIGGFTKGIEQAYENYAHEQIGQSGDSGYERRASFGRVSQLPTCLGYAEIDRYASAIYRYHYPDHKNYGDVTRIASESLPGFDLLTGGFPCQAFSIAGKRAGFNDTRGTLFFEIARILSDRRPTHFLLENVRGLVSHDAGKTLQTILTVLADLGYFVETVVLNSKDYGVPQNRERVFFIGHLAERCGGEILHFGSGDELFETGGGQGQAENQYSTAITSNYRKGVHSGGETYVLNQIGHLSTNAEAHRVYDGNGLARTIKNGGGMGAKTGLYAVGNIDPDANFTQGNILYSTEGVAGTLRNQHSIGAADKYLVNRKIRRLTPTECERLQAFPDDWTKFGADEKGNVFEVSDSQRYKCLGNAVTVSVVEALITAMIEKECLNFGIGTG